MELKNKYALVLGASRGVGRAMARTLAGQGMRLILPRFDWPESSDEMEAEFSGGGQKHLVVRIDLRGPAEVRQLAAMINSEFGRLHVLINNIERGGMPVVHGSYERKVNEHQWLLEQETTLRAKWLVFQACLPLLRKAEQAAVVNISSIAGLVGRSGPAGLLFNDGYAAANRGISSLTETWARMGAPTIRVNEVMLGFIDHRHGPGTRGWDLLSAEEKQRLLAHIPLGRTGSPDEVGRTVLHIIRDAEYMTGSVIRLDGGYVLGGDEVGNMPDGIL